MSREASHDQGSEGAADGAVVIGSHAVLGGPDGNLTRRPVRGVPSRGAVGTAGGVAVGRQRRCDSGGRRGRLGSRRAGRARTARDHEREAGHRDAGGTRSGRPRHGALAQ